MKANGKLVAIALVVAAAGVGFFVDSRTAPTSESSTSPAHHAPTAPAKPIEPVAAAAAAPAPAMPAPAGAARPVEPSRPVAPIPSHDTDEQNPYKILKATEDPSAPRPDAGSYADKTIQIAPEITE